MTPVPARELAEMQPGEPSAAIRERVTRARSLQQQRYEKAAGIYCNAQMTDRMMQEYCALDEASSRLLRSAMDRFDLSARAYSRILKVARTIADLAGSATIQPLHIAEAVGYRNLDRGTWGE